jgi:hypothetical protein
MVLHVFRPSASVFFLSVQIDRDPQDLVDRLARYYYCYARTFELRSEDVIRGAHVLRRI